jgi:hypothetical protein
MSSAVEAATAGGGPCTSGVANNQGGVYVLSVSGDISGAKTAAAT